MTARQGMTIKEKSKLWSFQDVIYSNELKDIDTMSLEYSKLQKFGIHLIHGYALQLEACLMSASEIIQDYIFVFEYIKTNVLSKEIIYLRGYLLLPKRKDLAWIQDHVISNMDSIQPETNVSVRSAWGSCENTKDSRNIILGPWKPKINHTAYLCLVFFFKLD